MARLEWIRARRAEHYAQVADRLGLRGVPDGATLPPYKAAPVSFRRAQCASLAASVGGGYCGPAPSSVVASAALQLAWSRHFSDLAAVGGNPDLALTASRLAESQAPTGGAVEAPRPGLPCIGSKPPSLDAANSHTTGMS
jgi:hypothetical protein